MLFIHRYDISLPPASRYIHPVPTLYSISNSTLSTSNGSLESHLFAMAIFPLQHLSLLHLHRFLHPTRRRRRRVPISHRKDPLPGLLPSTELSVSPSSYFRAANDLHLPSRLPRATPTTPSNRNLDQAPPQTRTTHHIQLPRR